MASQARTVRVPPASEIAPAVGPVRVSAAVRTRVSEATALTLPIAQLVVVAAAHSAGTARAERPRLPAIAGAQVSAAVVVASAVVVAANAAVAVEAGAVVVVAAGEGGANDAYTYETARR